MPTMTKIQDNLSYNVLDMICDEATIAGQKFEYTNIVKVCVRLGIRDSVHKLRVRISRDSYDFQSWARVERWDGKQWQLVHSLAGTDERVKFLPTSYAAAHDLRGAQEQFGDLSTELLKTAMRIVAG